MTARYTPSHTPPIERTEPALWFAFRDGQIAVCEGDASRAFRAACILPTSACERSARNISGFTTARHCYAVELDGARELPQGWRFMGLRDAFAVLDAELAALSGRAFQILEWDRNQHYCSRCGTHMLAQRRAFARVPGCGYKTYRPFRPP